MSARSSGAISYTRIGLRDVIVLAVDTAQVAPAEENGTASASPHQWPLLPKMRSEGDDPDAVAGLTESTRLFGAVGPALVWTDNTMLKPGVHYVGSSFEFSGNLKVGVAHFGETPLNKHGKRAVRIHGSILTGK